MAKGYHNWCLLNQDTTLRGYIWCCDRGLDAGGVIH